MGFLDEIKRLTHPYDDEMEDDDYDEDEYDEDEDYDQPEPEPAPPPRDERRSRGGSGAYSSGSSYGGGSSSYGGGSTGGGYGSSYGGGGYQDAPRGNGKVVTMHATTQLQVVLVKPERYENASEIADHLRDKRTVVLNLEKTDKDISRRLLDFLSGVAYAQEGKIKKVALSTYIVTPYNVDIMGDIIDELENNGVYF